MTEMIREHEEIWLEIIPDSPSSALRDELESLTIDTRLDILRFRDRVLSDAALYADGAEETLEEMDPHDVFERLLDARRTEEEKRPSLRAAYEELLHEMENADDGPETD